MQRDRQLRTHTRMSEGERQAIREKRRQNPTWSKNKLAEWASDHFSRPVGQKMIRNVLKARYAYGEVVQYVADSRPCGALPLKETMETRSQGGGWTTPGQIPSKAETLATNIISASPPSPSSKGWISLEDILDGPLPIAKSSRTSRFQLVEETDVVAEEAEDGTRRNFNWDTNNLKAGPKPFNAYLVQFLSGIVTDALNNSSKATIDPFTPWFTLVFNRASRSGCAPLDEALRSVLVRHAGMVTGDQGVIRKSRQLYGRALGAIQKTINSRSRSGLTADLVSATMLLGCFELFDATSDQERDPFPHHVRGTAQLAKLLGPESFADDYGRTVLAVFSHYLLFTVDAAPPDLFLVSEDWKTVKARAQGTDTPWQLRELIMDFYHNSLAFRSLKQESIDSDSNPEKSADSNRLLVRLLHLRAMLADWRMKFQSLIPPLDERSGVYQPNSPKAESLWSMGLLVSLAISRMIALVQPDFIPAWEEHELIDSINSRMNLTPLNTFLAKRLTSQLKNLSGSIEPLLDNKLAYTALFAMVWTE